MDTRDLTLVVRAIVDEQKNIIGPLAIEEANKVVGLKVSDDLETIQVSGESKNVLADLVGQYEKLFGQASIEVCKDAVREVQPPIPTKDLPAILQ